MNAALSPSWFAVGLIELYQRYLSPYKGFRCAHRARKTCRTSSCSQFAKRAIARVGVIAGLPLIGRRFERCKQSARVLDYEPQTDRRKQEQRNVLEGCDPGSACDADGCFLAGDALQGLPDACSGLHHAPHNCGAADGLADACGSAADFGACDCSFH
jgi:putative component of membrane protein insertase Oxa1/YidC/SpoIIIJ protein YidD